jgi:sugar O-acyltransferase (sialic acid O-acetyltransferase NeuD family)
VSFPKPFDSNSTLLIFGAGGHGRVLVDAALLAHKWQRIVVSDRKLPENQSELLPGIRLLAVDAAVALDPSIHIAIGSNQFRQKEASALGYGRLVSVVHPAAVVSTFSSIGQGCFVAAGAIVGPLAQLGMAVIVNHGAVVDHDVEVGSFSHIAPNASLGGHAKLGQRVLIGSGAVVLPTIVIGDDVTVGAGSVVNANLLESGTYAGIPARKIL